jgi:hypothetical protein
MQNFMLFSTKLNWFKKMVKMFLEKVIGKFGKEF